MSASAFVPELGWQVGERFRVVDVWCNQIDGAILNDSGDAYVVKLGFPPNAVSVGVGSIDGVIDLPPGVASSEASMVVSEGLPLGDTNNRLEWNENDTQLSITLPKTFTPISQINALNTTWTVTTSIPHYFLPSDVGLNLSFAICGVITDGWAILTSVVDAVTLEFTVPASVVAVYNQELTSTPLQLYFPSITSRNLCIMTSSRMTSASIHGWAYNMNVGPFASITATSAFNESMTIQLFPRGTEQRGNVYTRLGFGRMTSTNINNSLTVTLVARGEFSLGVPMVLGRVPNTPGDMASIVAARLNSTAFTGTYTYQVLAPGGATGSVTLNNTNVYLPTSLERLFSNAYVSCTFTGSQFSFRSLVSDWIRITFSDFSTARRLGLPASFVCDPSFSGAQQDPPFPCSSMSIPYLPLTLQYQTQIEPIGGRLILSATTQPADALVSYTNLGGGQARLDVAEDATTEPIPQQQIVALVDTGAVPSTTVFLTVASIANATGNKQITVNVHSSYAFTGPTGTLQTASTDPAESRFDIYNAVEFGYRGSDTLLPVAIGIQEHLYYGSSANRAAWYESVNGNPVTAPLPPIGSGTAKAPLYVQISSQQVSIPPTGAVWSTSSPNQWVTSVVTVDPGTRCGYGEGLVVIPQQTQPAYPTGGNPTREFQITLWDITRRPWTNMGFPFLLRLRITFIQTEAVHPPRENLPGNPVATNFPR